MEQAHDGCVVAANMGRRRQKTPEGEAAMTIMTNGPAHTRTHHGPDGHDTDASPVAERMLGVGVPELAMTEKREASLGELLDDPIMHLLLARDGVRREDVVNIVRSVASRLACNDCGKTDGLAVA
jgi:hypothetical protein